MTKTAPLAVRLKAEMRDAIDRYAEVKGVNRNRAITDLLGQALASNGFGSPGFERIHAGLKEAVEIAEGRAQPARVYNPSPMVTDQAARDAKYARRDTWDPRFAAAPKKGRK